MNEFIAPPRKKNKIKNGLFLPKDLMKYDGICVQPNIWAKQKQVSNSINQLTSEIQRQVLI